MFDKSFNVYKTFGTPFKYKYEIFYNGIQKVRRLERNLYCGIMFSYIPSNMVSRKFITARLEICRIFIS